MPRLISSSIAFQSSGRMEMVVRFTIEEPSHTEYAGSRLAVPYWRLRVFPMAIGKTPTHDTPPFVCKSIDRCRQSMQKYARR